MRRFMNSADDYVNDMLEGIYAAHPNIIKSINNDLRCYVKIKRTKGKVGIMTGGGSGHLPLFLGYVGDGMLDGCAVGDVFQSPSSIQIYEVTKHIESGAGVLYIYGNYTGDIMNFDMAAEMADIDGIEIQTVIGNDDVASGPKGEEEKRRGVAGIFFVYKCAGAKAQELAPLEEVKRIAEKANANVRTIGVALSPCIIPQVGKPGFKIPEGEMALGMGIHGEPGIYNGNLKPADQIVDELIKPILEDLNIASGDDIAVLVNGLGATPKEELYIMFKRVNQIMKEKKVSVYRTYVGEFATSMEMAGASISILRLDNELKKLLDSPADTPFFTQKG